MAKAIYSEEQRAIVEVLVAARREKGVLQADLAKRLGRDQSFVSNIERGQRRVDVLELYAIARALEVDPVALYRRMIEKLPVEVSV